MSDRVELFARFWSKVNTSGRYDDCWNWTGAKTAHGYGNFWTGEAMIAAHRIAYEQVVGPIPEGIVLDHLCRNRGCVNPLHLEPVTHKENCLRGVGVGAINAKKTHCANGHVLFGRNVYVSPKGRRACRVCNRASAARSKQRRKAAAVIPEAVTE